MSGIDRLRAIAGAWDEWGLGGVLADVADEIERERACDADTIENIRLIVGGVIDDMERHCLGHEGMEDSPVARWARELREALKSDASDGSDRQKPSCADPDGAADVTSEAQKVTRDHAKFQKSRKVANSLTSHSDASDVSMSSYDLLPQEERDAIAWVRKHGGIDYVKREWRSRVPYDRYEARRQSLLGHIAECETALGRRNRRIEELEGRVKALTNENAELRRRAMPEGCEWPRYESGEPVGFGDEASRLGEVWRICLYRDGSFSLNFRSYSKGERVRRPAKVLDADRVEIRVGETVWHTRTGDEYSVIGVPSESVINVSRQLDGREMHGVVSPYSLTHRAPVLAADGSPLRKGEHVYHVETGAELVVKELPKPGMYQAVVVFAPPASHLTSFDPDQLTHRAPVLAADGEPLEVGQTVWDTNGDELIIGAIEDGGHTVTCRYADVGDSIPVHGMWSPSQLTHTKPEPPDRAERIADEIDRLREEVALHLGDYLYDEDGNDSIQLSMELVAKRCRALAERERGE